MNFFGTELWKNLYVEKQSYLGKQPYNIILIYALITKILDIKYSETKNLYNLLRGRFLSLSLSSQLTPFLKELGQFPLRNQIES